MELVTDSHYPERFSQSRMAQWLIYAPEFDFTDLLHSKLGQFDFLVTAMKKYLRIAIEQIHSVSCRTFQQSRTLE